VCVWLEGDGPIVEELEMLLLLAAGRNFRRGTTLATTAVQFTGGFFGSSPSLWWCSVMLCSLLACAVCVVVFALARYVPMLLLLIRRGSAPDCY
jgi:hypothetical protein